jgi:quercetin dioxygenase-like cupin family protein
MNRKAHLDPDDPVSAELIETRLAEALAPIPVPAEASALLRQRLFDRARASREGTDRFIHVRHDEGRWRHLASGVRFKLLHESHGGRSVLVDLPPGGSLPTHRHHEHEECVVLRGSAQLGPLTVHEGDYHVAPPGSRHGHVSSRDGALLYLRGVPIGDRVEVVRDLVTAWLPGKGPSPITVRADEGVWQDAGPGIATKALWHHGDSQSMLVRMQPGARMKAAEAIDEERLLLQGEIFAGDMLLRAGDFQFAARSVAECEVETDIGALFFVRATADGGLRAHAVTPR